MEDIFLQVFDKTQLMRLILSFYRDNPDYKMSPSEFIGIVCVLSNQVMRDIGWKNAPVP